MQRPRGRADERHDNDGAGLKEQEATQRLRGCSHCQGSRVAARAPVVPDAGSAGVDLASASRLSWFVPH